MTTSFSGTLLALASVASQARADGSSVGIDLVRVLDVLAAVAALATVVVALLALREAGNTTSKLAELHSEMERTTTKVGEVLASANSIVGELQRSGAEERLRHRIRLLQDAASANTRMALGREMSGRPAEHAAQFQAVADGARIYGLARIDLMVAMAGFGRDELPPTRTLAGAAKDPAVYDRFRGPATDELEAELRSALDELATLIAGKR